MPTTDLDNVARRLVIKDIQSGHDLIDVFKQLSQIDDDFNGNNGPDYLWDVAKKVASDVTWTTSLIVL